MTGEFFRVASVADLATILHMNEATTAARHTALKIVDVVDTRHRDDDGKVIPFSGDARPCDVCGKAHEIHVTLSDGRIVGKTCAMNKLGFFRVPAASIRRTVKIVGNGTRVVVLDKGRQLASYSNPARPITVDEVASIWAKDHPNHDIIKVELAAA